MIIIPSIDLMNGSCVRLKQGDFAEQQTYEIAPAMMAKRFRQDGARALHIVDLQGAKRGQLMQLQLIASIVAEFGDGVQAGGGVRTDEDIDALLMVGVQRVVLGTRLVTDQNDIQALVNDYSTEQLVFAVDFRLKDNVPYVAMLGWQTDRDRERNNFLFLCDY